MKKLIIAIIVLAASIGPFILFPVPSFSGLQDNQAQQNQALTSQQDLERGWYWGGLKQKKPGTPSDWIHDGEGSRSACWHKPGVRCGQGKTEHLQPISPDENHEARCPQPMLPPPEVEDSCRAEGGIMKPSIYDDCVRGYYCEKADETRMSEERSCNTDEDCSCGRHRVTGECFLGNKRYVTPERPCPDFCSGIAGNLRVKCIDNECKHVQAKRSEDPKNNCFKEGEGIPVIPNAPPCCQRLTLIKPKDARLLGSKGICTSKCGDGVCDPATETVYNCPRDCKPADNPFSRRVWDKYDYPFDAPGWEGTDWYNALTIKEDENQAYGMYLFQFMKKGRPVYIGWFECFDVQECSRIKIYTGVEINFDKNTKQVKITKASPKHQSGKAAFETETKTVSGGKVIIFLNEVPVFVEEQL